MSGIIQINGNLSSEIRNEILEQVKSNHFVILRGLIEREEVRSKIDKIWNFLLTNKHYGSSDVPKEAIRELSSKWSVGGESPIQKDIARFMLTIYAPMNSHDFFGINEWFKTLIMVRDLCAGRPKPLFDEDLEKPFFNGTRLQVYPSGGGFMSSHLDSTATNTFNASGDGLFLQPLLLITERGIDYERGGAFYENQDSSKVYLEDLAKSGDIVVYDESIKHGVGDVDPQLPLNLESRKGRIVALSTIYK